jgi:hypothetical protein
MTDDKKPNQEDDLTAKDKELLRLYDETASPIEWDESDDEILAFAREHAPANKNNAVEEDISAKPLEAPANDPLPEGDNIVSFGSAKKKTFSLQHSPVAKFAMAACLVVGIFMGQGVTPYLDLGVAPSYKDLKEEKQALEQKTAQLEEQVVQTRSLRLRKTPTETPSQTPLQNEPSAIEPGLLQLRQLSNDFSCATLSFSVLPDTSLEISGFVSNDSDYALLSEKAAQYASAFPNIIDRVDVLGWPFCQARQILSSSTGAGNTSPIIRPLNHSTVYSGGEELQLELTAGLSGGYLYVDFLQHDGTVIHLLPFEGNAQNALQANERVTIGAGDVRYELAAPYGTEMIYVIQTKEPLFDSLRSEVEPADVYFTQLRDALENQRVRGLGNAIQSNFLTITTQE